MPNTCPGRDVTKHRLDTEIEVLDKISTFLLKQLKRETDSSNKHLEQVVTETSAKLESEIDTLKSQIRLERRRFLDANPSESTAVAGLYYTEEGDNRAIIIFLVCFGLFLLIGSMLFLYGLIPLAYDANTTFSQRLIVVAATWVVSLVAMYIGFFTLT